MSAFVMVSPVWSVYCLLFFSTHRVPRCPPFVKLGGHVPPVRHRVGATAYFFLNKFYRASTNEHTGYCLGQLHCGPPIQNFGWAIAYPVHPAAPLWATLSSPLFFKICGYATVLLGLCVKLITPACEWAPYLKLRAGVISYGGILCQ